MNQVTLFSDVSTKRISIAVLQRESIDWITQFVYDSIDYVGGVSVVGVDTSETGNSRKIVAMKVRQKERFPE